MPKLKDFLKSMAIKAGVPETSPELIKVLGLEALNDLEVDAALSNVIDRNLLTVDAAKSNPDVKAALKPVIYAETMNGFDAELDRTMSELGLTDDVKAELLAEKSSTKRATMLAKKVKEVEAAANKDGATSEKKELIQTINDLKKELTKVNGEHEIALKAKDNDIANQLLQKEMEFDLFGLKYNMPDEVPQSVKINAAKSVIEQELKADGAKVVIVNGVKKLVREDGTDWTDETHRAVPYKDYISGKLAKNNLLTVSDPNNPAPDKTKFPDKIDGNNPTTKVNSNFLSAVDSDLENISKFATP